MVSKKNPGVRVSVAPTIFGTYTDITDYVQRIEVEDAGLQKISKAVIVLRNPDGRFTDPGQTATFIDLFSAVKIEFAVRESDGVPVWDEVFRGWFYEDDSELIGLDEPSLRMICYGLLQQAKEDTKTKMYAEENKAQYPDSPWHLDDVINDIFANPDSGNDINLNLVIDPPDDGYLGTTLCRHNFKQPQSLFNILRKLLNEAWDSTNNRFIQYDGYVVPEETFMRFDVHVHDIVNHPQAADPAVILQRGAEVYRFKPFSAITKLANKVYVWGDVDVGKPADGDRWTEDAVWKHAATSVLYDDDETVWTAFGGGTGTLDISISENATDQVRGNSCLQVAVDALGTYEYVGVSLVPPSADWSTIDNIAVFLYGIANNGKIRIEVIDSLGNSAYRDITDDWSGWRRFTFPRTSGWTGTVDWTNVSQLRIMWYTTGTRYVDLTYLETAPAWYPQWDATICDEYQPSYVKKGKRSIRVFDTDQTGGALLVLSNTDLGGTLDLSDFKTLQFQMGNFSASIIERLWVYLEDSAGNQIAFKPGRQYETNAWHRVLIGVGSDQSIASAERSDGWYFVAGTSFNWTAVANVYFFFYIGAAGCEVYIDALMFALDRKIDPIKYPTADNPAYDATSRGDYGMKVYHHGPDATIHSFDDANEIAKALLARRKDPIKKFRVEAQGFPWVKPAQTVTLILPEYGIDAPGVTYRVVSIKHTWEQAGNNLKTEFDLVESTQQISPRYIFMDEAPGVITAEMEGWLI